MLVGREPEQRRIDALVSSARIGQSAVLVLTGVPGIGKTALLEYAVSQTAGMRVLRVTGSHSEQHLPFAGLAQLLRAKPADLDALPAPQGQALGVALALRPGEGIDRFAVGAAALTLLTRLSEQQPLAVVVDDAHLVDRASQQALVFVMRRLLADALIVLAAARTDDPCEFVADDLPRLEVTGIDLAATRDLVLAGRAQGRSHEATARIAALAEGNPLAILELAADPAAAASRWPNAPGHVSSSLTRLYAARAAALDPAARQVLLLAATAGEDLRLISRACEAAALDSGLLVAAERLGLIEIGPDRVRFAHPLTRAAVYSGASAGERRMLHSTVAGALPAQDHDRRAWHRSEAALGPDDDVAVELELLADRAAVRGAFSLAATAYSRAAQLSTDGRSSALRSLRAGEAAWRAGDWPHARALLRAVLQQVPGTLVAVDAQRLLGVVAARSGSVVEARDVLRAAAAMATALEAPAHALACQVEVVQVCFYLADADGGLAAATRIEALLADGVPVSQAPIALVAAGMGRVVAGRGGADLIRRGTRLLVAAGASGEQVDDSSWAVLGPLFLREVGAGRQLVRSAIDDQRARAALGTLPHLLFHIARDEATSDRWNHAAADYSEAIALAREFGQTTELAMSTAGMAWLVARRGASDQATAMADTAEALGHEHGIHLARVWAQHALGDLALGLGAAGLAIERYRALDAMMRGLGVLDVDLSPVPELVEALLHAGRRTEAEGLAGAHAQRAELKGQPWALARAGRVRGLLCPDDEVDSSFDAALTMHTATPDSYEQARTRLAYGARLRRARRRIDARPQLQQALDVFQALGALPWADRAAQELVATGATALRAGTDAAGRLTPRELQIALLLSDGSTVREAAASLFLSPKTVEYHLRHVYIKLGIASREQLGERLRPSAARP
jgi:DNA-binding CsgD family transcriptional regulator